MRFSKSGCVVRWSGGTMMLKRGQSIDDNHPLVAERPDLFTDEDPGASVKAPTVERATAAPGEVRTTPGRGPRQGLPKSGSGQ